MQEEILLMTAIYQSTCTWYVVSPHCSLCYLIHADRACDQRQLPPKRWYANSYFTSFSKRTWVNLSNIRTSQVVLYQYLCSVRTIRGQLQNLICQRIWWRSSCQKNCRRTRIQFQPVVQHRCSKNNRPTVIYLPPPHLLLSKYEIIFYVIVKIRQQIILELDRATDLLCSKTRLPDCNQLLRNVGTLKWKASETSRPTT